MNGDAGGQQMRLAGTDLQRRVLRVLGLGEDEIETKFGFHIIKVERRRPGERNARHILIVPERTEDDVALAREVAMQVRQQAESGTSMSELYDEFSDPAAPDSITFAFEQLPELPPAYEMLRTASAGDFVGPKNTPLARQQLEVALVVDVRLVDVLVHRSYIDQWRLHHPTGGLHRVAVSPIQLG